jgi:hypothetical protein
LDCGKSFSEDNETVVSLGSDVVDSGSDQDLLILESFIELLDISPYSVTSKDGLQKWIVSVLIYLVVNDFDSFVLLHVTKISC